MAEAYIIDAVRTPVGRRGGGLSDVHPADLGAAPIVELFNRVDVDPALIDDVVYGCVDAIGGQAGDIARTAWLVAGMPQHVPGTTIDRQCGSSQQAIQFAAQAVMSGTQDVVIAAGGESMSRVPMFSNYTLHGKEGVGVGPFSARVQERFGVPAFSQFDGAEMIARKYGFDRETLDRYALQSHQRGAAATAAGAFDAEIVPLIGFKVPRRSRSSVVFPAPDGPTMPVN
jgi:acetyl-CoA C-acetyltransferase